MAMILSPDGADLPESGSFWECCGAGTPGDGLAEELGLPPGDWLMLLSLDAGGGRRTIAVAGGEWFRMVSLLDRIAVEIPAGAAPLRIDGDGWPDTDRMLDADDERLPFMFRPDLYPGAPGGS